MLYSLASAVKQSIQVIMSKIRIPCHQLYMQNKREFLLSPVSHGLKFLVITNSALIYINIFTMGYCEVFMYIYMYVCLTQIWKHTPCAKIDSEMKSVEAAVLHK